MFTPKVRLLKPRTATLLLLLAAAVGWVSLSSVRLGAEDPAKDAKPAEKSPPLRLIHPEERDITAPIGQPVFVEPYQRTSIYAKVAGYIEKWKVDIGDKVKKGDVLATILAPELKEEWTTKKAQVQVAEGRVELAKQALKIKQAEVKSAEARLVAAKAAQERGTGAAGAVTVSEAEVVEKQAAAAHAEVAVKIALAERTVALSEANRLETLVGYLTLRAPYDGIIVARNVNTFDFVSPPQGNPSDRPRAVAFSRSDAPIYVIDRIDIVRVVVDIPEGDGDYVQIGTAARVRISGYRDEPITAVVSHTSWMLDNNLRSLRAEIYLPNPKGLLLPGMYAYGKVFIKRPRRVWTLPVDALDEIDNKICYWEYKRGRALRREVRTGSSDDKWVEVFRRRAPAPGGAKLWVPIDGSENVIVGDLSVLSNGKAVKVANPPSSP